MSLSFLWRLLFKESVRFMHKSLSGYASIMQFRIKVGEEVGRYRSKVDSWCMKSAISKVGYDLKVLLMLTRMESMSLSMGYYLASLVWRDGKSATAFDKTLKASSHLFSERTSSPWKCKRGTTVWNSPMSTRLRICKGSFNVTRFARDQRTSQWNSKF